LLLQQAHHNEEKKGGKMQERNIINGFTASVLSPFIEGWQQMI
jgi:hypothetical protein